ncbi:MAG: hypothetical protein WDO73_35815 [Ignavibacteriota bacterium]
MKLTRSIPVLLVAVGLHAEIIDRIAVSVGNQAITTSDVDREIRVTAFLNRSEPDFTPAGRRATAIAWWNNASSCANLRTAAIRRRQPRRSTRYSKSSKG